MKCFTKDEIEIVIKLLQTDLKLFLDNRIKLGDVIPSHVSKLILSLLKFEDDTLSAFDYTGDKGLINDQRLPTKADT